MNIKLDAKPFQETLHADMCGPASLKIVMDYYGVNKSENELAKLTNLTPGIGVIDKDIIEAAKILGFSTEVKNDSTFEDVELWLNKGVPVIVDWFTRGRSDYNDSEVADGHYSVVIGLDDDYIYLQDPEIGKERKIMREDFMKVWFDFTGENIKPEELVIRQLIAVYK
ncbi:MAG: C39 family peptidase [Candidatus Paceibacterota bacterium]|jgi:predicted double-glycine peptidase